MSQTITRNRIAQYWLHYALLALFTFLVYWPLSTFQHATKWDSVETYFPFRYFLSDCLRNGELPLWMPYQLGGYPFFADPQSGAWYPVAWIFCGLMPYTLSTLALEIVISVFLGGVGMYRLTKSFELNNIAALIAGMSYIACGFFISNAEHLTWVVSAAWLPWIFWSYHRLVSGGGIGYALLAGLFLYLLLSGGYPAFITVTLYLLILFFLILFFRRQAASARWQLIWLHGAMAGIFLLLSVGLMWSWLQFFSLMSRGAEMSLEAVQVHPFSPQCLDSLLLPFASLKGDEIYRSDISMRNAYIGLSCLLMLPFLSLKKSNRKLQIIGVVALLCLAAAFGPFSPIRGWLYEFVPMMRLFRFPALFRIFFIIGAILIAAHGVHACLEDLKGNRRKLLWVVAGLMGTFAIILLWSIFQSGFTWNWGRSYTSFLKHLSDATRTEHIQLQSFLQVMLVGGLLVVCLIRKGRFLKPGTLVVFCMTELIVASALNAYGTVVTMQPRQVQERPIVDAPRNFVVPENSVPVSSYSDGRRGLGELRTNTSIYFKTPAADGYNSFTLISFNQLGASPIRDSVWANPYLYFASGTYVIGPDQIPKQKEDVGLSPRDYERLNSISIRRSAVDSIQVSSFRPNEISATVHTAETALLNMQQNYAAGWTLFVDGNRTDIVVTNYTQMAGIIPPGIHKITWKFDPQEIRIMACWTLAELVLLCAGLIVYRKKIM